jgi:hypothetical protein
VKKINKIAVPPQIQMTDSTNPNQEEQVEPDSYHEAQEQTHPPKEGMRKPVSEPSREQEFHAHGVNSVNQKLDEAQEKTAGHSFDEAITILEDALEDLEKLQEGPESTGNSNTAADETPTNSK